MTGDDAESIAWEACRESGLDDRPRCDPLVFAACFLGLRLCPRPGAEPRLAGGRLIYPSDAADDAIAYYVSHENGHDLAIAADVDPAIEEQVASRIGVALMLPRSRYLRDLGACGWDIDALRALWPLASLWIHARRIAEVTRDGAVASRWTRRTCVDRVITEDVEGLPTSPMPIERELARAAMSGVVVEASPRMRAWPTMTGAIVICDAGQLHETRLDHPSGTAARITRR